MNNSQVSPGCFWGNLTSELKPVSDTAGYHGKQLSSSPRFYCLHRHGLRQGTCGYKTYWNDIRVMILRQKYTNKLNDWLKSEPSQVSYQSIMYTNISISRPVFPLLISQFLSPGIETFTFLFSFQQFQRKTITFPLKPCFSFSFSFACKMKIIIHMTKRCYKD